MMNDKLRAAAKAALEVLDILSKLGNGDVDGDSKGNSIAQDARQNLRAAIEADSSWLIKYSKAALAEPEQEPVAWYHDDFCALEFSRVQRLGRLGWRPLYTAPPRREWVGLTGADFEKENVNNSFLAGASFAAAKLKEKNGG